MSGFPFINYDGTEPTGWYRNPQTGRRRPDGDPNQEYICR